MLKIHEIEQIQIELTTRCNARCPLCARNYRGMDHNDGYPETELRLADIQRMFSPEFLKQIKKVLFNGNLGDFGLAKDSIEIVKYFLANGVKEIDISTNGSMRTADWWTQLALPGVTVGFALDGLADTHSLYRQDTDWNKIIENARALIAAGGRAVWRFIPFEHNRHQMEGCREISQHLGFADFQNIGHGRDRTFVYTRAGKYSHLIGKPFQESDITNPPPVRDLLQHHLTWFDPKTYQQEQDTPDLEINCYHKRVKELYVAANGEIYPCCYLGFYPQTMFHPGNEQLKPIVKENNALHHSLETCIEWFNGVEESWSKESIADGRLYTCVNTCAVKKAP
jgi:MoaA/NifB/PqqE/SkfB family radical SAM enzyme